MDSLPAAPRASRRSGDRYWHERSSSLIDAGAEDRAYEAVLCGTPLTPLPSAEELVVRSAASRARRAALLVSRDGGSSLSSAGLCGTESETVNPWSPPASSRRQPRPRGGHPRPATCDHQSWHVQRLAGSGFANGHSNRTRRNPFESASASVSLDRQEGVDTNVLPPPRGAEES